MRVKITIAALVALTACSSESVFRLRDQCRGVCGRVIDVRSGSPVTSYTIAVFSGDARIPAAVANFPPGMPIPPGPMLTMETITAENGAFEIDTSPASKVYLAIKAPGYQHQQTPAIATGTEKIRIELAPARFISGVVRDEAGRPLPEVEIHSDSRQRPLWEALDRIVTAKPLARTDSAGRFTIEEPLLDSFPILVRAGSHLPLRAAIRKSDTEVRLTLRSGVELGGIVRSTNGEVVNGAVVEAACDGLESLRTFTKSDGTFRFPVLPRGRCRVEAARRLVESDRSVVLSSDRGSVEVEAPAALPVEIELPPQ